MTQRGVPAAWLAATAGAAIVLAVLSFVPAWIDHFREMRGEGYRTLSLDLSAWQGGAVPILASGVVVVVLVGLAAATWPWLRRGRASPVLLPLAAGVGFGLVAAAAWPLAHVGQVSGLWLNPSWAMLAGLVLATVVVVGSLRLAAPRRWVTGATLALAVLAAGAGIGTRAAILSAAESDRPHWSDGSYHRDGESLVLEEGTYRFGERWSGAFTSSGLTVVLTDDPACPDARGAYRIFDGGDDDIRWELIVDICADGARTDEIVGTWHRGE